jgi:ComF family protein
MCSDGCFLGRVGVARAIFGRMSKVCAGVVLTAWFDGRDGPAGFAGCRCPTGAPGVGSAADGDGRFGFAGARVCLKGSCAEAILAFKYGHRDDLAPALSVPLIRVFKERAELHKNQCVIPVPLHFLKRHGRGFNQAELLGRGLADGVGVPLLSGVLVRRRWTWAQARLGRDQRKTNVAGAFVVRNPEFIREKRLLLVDDVCTTGATLESCANALKEAGARSVDALTLARDYTGPRPNFR